MLKCFKLDCYWLGLTIIDVNVPFNQLIFKTFYQFSGEQDIHKSLDHEKLFNFFLLQIVKAFKRETLRLVFAFVSLMIWWKKTRLF
jgi:hypothetical protein